MTPYAEQQWAQIQNRIEPVLSRPGFSDYATLNYALPAEPAPPLCAACREATRDATGGTRACLLVAKEQCCVCREPRELFTIEPPHAPVRLPDHGALRDKSSIMESLERELEEGIAEHVQRADELAERWHHGRDPYAVHRISEQCAAEKCVCGCLGREHVLGKLEREACSLCGCEKYVVGERVKSPTTPKPAEYTTQRLTRAEAWLRERSSASLALRAEAPMTGTVAGLNITSAERWARAEGRAVTPLLRILRREVLVRELFAVNTSIRAHFPEGTEGER